jgi:hypothetical protein
MSKSKPQASLTERSETACQLMNWMDRAKYGRLILCNAAHFKRNG